MSVLGVRGALLPGYC